MWVRGGVQVLNFSEYKIKNKNSLNKLKKKKKTERNWIFNMKSGFELSAWPFVPFGFGCPGNGCNNAGATGPPQPSPCITHV